MPETIRERITVAVDAGGKYYAIGGNDIDDRAAEKYVAAVTDEKTARSWIEADVEVPTFETPEPIRGEIVK